MRSPGRLRMPTKPPLGFVGGRAVHEGPRGGCPFPQHVYDAVAVALAQRMSVERMQVDVHGLTGMPRKAVLQLAKKVEAGGRVPGRHGRHRNHTRSAAPSAPSRRAAPSRWSTDIAGSLGPARTSHRLVRAPQRRCTGRGTGGGSCRRTSQRATRARRSRASRVQLQDARRGMRR